MKFERKYLLSSERKRLHIWITVCSFLITALVFGTFRAKFPEYRLIDLILVPIYTFVATLKLSNTRAMEQIWANASTRIVIVLLCVAIVLGMAIPATVSAIIITGLILCGMGLIACILARPVIGRDPDYIAGFGTIMWVGFGFGFGLKSGFLFGFVAGGVLYMFFYYAEDLFASIVQFSLWNKVKSILWRN
mgnify:CR=1 FL=1